MKIIVFLTQITCKFGPNGPVDNVSKLVEVMAWCPMMAFFMHVCVSWPNKFDVFLSYQNIYF